jgi:hypothetical protein
MAVPPIKVKIGFKFSEDIVTNLSPEQPPISTFNYEKDILLD